MESQTNDPLENRGADSDSAASQRFCLYVLVQLIRGRETGQLQDTIRTAVSDACVGEMATKQIGDMKIDYCELNCKVEGCDVSAGYWETSLQGEGPFIYSHSKEEIQKRGCKKEMDFRTKMAE
jgi:hypothetical protein